MKQESEKIGEAQKKLIELPEKKKKTQKTSATVKGFMGNVY